MNFSKSKDRIWILQERNTQFWIYINEKVKSWWVNIDNLRKISKLWAQRTINELNSIIINLENQPDLWWITIEVREATRQTYIWLKDALNECNKLLESIDKDDAKNFLVSFIEVNKKLTSIFNFIEKTKIFFTKKLENRENKHLRWFLELIRNWWKLIKEAWKRISKIIIIWSLSTSIATAWVNSNDIHHIKEQSSKLVQGIITPVTKQENITKKPLLKSIQENPENIKSIPKFDEKIKILVDKFKKEDIFDPKNYKKWETWKDWNNEIVFVLFPNTSHNMSVEEKKVIIKALQKYYKTPTTDGEFWRSSRDHMIKIFYQTKTIKTSNNSINQDQQTNLEIVKRKITLEEFEKALLKLEWTKFVSWLSDCSNLFFKLFYKLQLIDFSLLKVIEHGSTTIMQQLTIDKRDFTEAKKWDLIYWSSSKYKWAKHIAYILNTDEKWAWIFDRSIDTWKTTKRFISWNKFAEKKDCIVWKPIFLA